MLNHLTPSSPTETMSRAAVDDKLTHARDIYKEPLQQTPIQCKLSIGAVDDPLEHEAGAMADKVMRMPEKNFIQRTCAHCEEEEKVQRKPLSSFIQRKSTEAGFIADANVSNQISTSRGSGQAIDSGTRSFMQARFGADFSNVNIHTGSEATSLNRELNAKAFTVGNDIYFNEGQYQPYTSQGKSLLAHELAHTIQQGGAQNKASRVPDIQREPDKKGSDYKIIRMHFDGKDLIVSGDGKEIFRYAGQSGRPVLLREEDVKQCGGDPVTDTYMNDKRFVGIKDFGPIPEGTYSFSAGSIENFTWGEEMSLIGGGIAGHDTTKIGNRNIHSGDWGRGRVALNPVKIDKGPCGNPQARSAFFLHGGLLAGSSGCIDIGGDFTDLSEFLSTYKGSVVLTVKYEQDPPSVRFWSGFTGAIAYKQFHFGHGPRLDLGYESGPAGNAGVVSTSYDIIAKWAGGALSVGVHVDIPFGDKESFVRAGLRGGADFRIFQGLYGRLQGGVGVDRTEAGTNFIWEAGGGLKYQFNKVELEVIYNHIAREKNDHAVNQMLVGLGLRL
jgi:hypothetical protein